MDFCAQGLRACEALLKLAVDIVGTDSGSVLFDTDQTANKGAPLIAFKQEE